MGYWAKYCLRIFLSVKINIIGRENIVNDEKFFIACSHQSMFETFFLQTIFNSPIFILKKELLKIPIFGLYLKKIGSISINRNKTTKENLGFFDEILKIVNNSKRPLLIFPQGTRVLPQKIDQNLKKALVEFMKHLKLNANLLHLIQVMYGQKINHYQIIKL